MGVELPLRVVVTILECCVTFSGVKLSIRSFVLFQLPVWIKVYHCIKEMYVFCRELIFRPYSFMETVEKVNRYVE